jgi:hypothetical protein
MMTPWNVACGVSTHAELVGREWIKSGHELRVFAPIEGKRVPVIAKDESYVTRCYTIDRELTSGAKTLYLNPTPFLNSDYEIFLLQDLEIMPLRGLLELWPQVKRKARTVYAIHEGWPPPYPEYYRFDWDAIVCFDVRYQREYSRKLPLEKFHIIPFPSHPISLGDRIIARRKLGLPENKKIILSYGIRVYQHFFVLPTLKELSQSYPLLYLILSANETPEVVYKVKIKYNFVEIREGTYPLEELYTYLHASDVLLIWKQAPDPNILLSSTVYLCLGSGCPIVIREGKYTQDLGDEVLKCRSPSELEEVLSGIFEGNEVDQRLIEQFCNKHAVPRVASQFIELFSSLSTSTRK